MKTTAKVFIWIGMILNFYLIFPIIVGINALNKLDNAKTKKELTTSAWLTFWFCNMIGGICMLRINEYDLTVTNTTTNTAANTVTKINTKEVKNVDKKLFANKDFKKVLFAVISSLLLSGLLIGITWWHSFENLTFFVWWLGDGIVFIFAIPAILFVVLLILSSTNKFTLLTPTKDFLFFINVMLSILFVISIIEICCYKQDLLVYDCGGYESYKIFTPFDFAESYGSCKLDIVETYDNTSTIVYAVFMAIICAILITINIILTIKYFKIKEPIIIEKNKVVKEKIIISPIEHEINNIKSLMDKGIIDEEEYKTLRKGIIEKYSKN